MKSAGQPGARSVSAPLSDPYAVPALEYQEYVDISLRHVAHALLVGVETKQAGPYPLLATEDGNPS